MTVISLTSRIDQIYILEASYPPRPTIQQTGNSRRYKLEDEFIVRSSEEFLKFLSRGLERGEL